LPVKTESVEKYAIPKKKKSHSIVLSVLDKGNMFGYEEAEED
jgi:hypothetical protein